MRRAIIAATVLIVSVSMTQAGTRADLSGDAVIDFATTMDMPLMTVGNVGNAGELSGESVPGGDGPDRICGAVDYNYRIGKFEVTAGQYTEFLNAVAAEDAHGLYNQTMADPTTQWMWGCNIQRHGSPGSYAYSVAADWEERPVNYVSWGDAARFANWLTNGMPTGAQDLTTTEDGSYFLNGATSDAALMAVTRKSPEDGGRYYIPTEDEWYKAAYHANDGVTGDYFDYPTGSDTAPNNDVSDPDPGNNANFYIDPGDWTLGDPYNRTEVGEFENSDSPYGTFDQGGNIWEWCEAILYGSGRGLRGASVNRFEKDLLASDRDHRNGPTLEHHDVGFRVSEVPEPGSAALMLIAGAHMVRRRRKRVA